MIQLVEVKEFMDLVDKMQIMNERTKKHTKDIQELRKLLRSVERGLDKGNI